MASLSTCHLGLWLGWQILLNLVKYCCYEWHKTMLRPDVGRVLSLIAFNVFVKGDSIQLRTYGYIMYLHISQCQPPRSVSHWEDKMCCVTYVGGLSGLSRVAFVTYM